ncbi:hypothetical protein CGMCC3_g14858 [Colletotrichum fructicola]|nr:uncharacterized protein CGMCC3_g14858 [Colletotrichum fructicola]KAE9569043.1 hypothetical protein CGMCC3_g14858 [Colletotrichum fructicola]
MGLSGLVRTPKQQQQQQQQRNGPGTSSGKRAAGDAPAKDEG